MKKFLQRFISFFLMFGLCIANFMSVNVGAASKQTSDNPADEIIVKLKPNIAINSILSKHGGKVDKSISKLKIHKIKVPGGKKLQTMLSELKNDPSVEYCQPNYEYKASYIPNDPDFSQQWGLTGIKADKAWDKSTGNNSIIIAVIDTGVDKDHPDLAPNLISGYNTIDSSTNTDDDNGHGSHVAGIAAGVIDNSKGISGVSGKSKIMPLKVLNSSGSGWTSDITEAVIWAADHGAKVINMSLGGSSYDQAYQDAVNYAYSKGVLIVAAAGNSNTSAPSYPAAFSNVMAVSAVDQNNSRAYFSNYGSYIDITAPGVNIYSTTYNNSYTTMSGTSMACPFVAGAAAFLWSMNNSLAPSQIESILEGSAVDLGYTGKDANFGYGLVDLYKAVQSLPSQPENPVPSSGATSAPTVLPSYTPAPTPDLVPIGNIDNPTDSETISGQYSVKGWFLDGDGVSKLEVIVDNNVTGNAVYGDLRSDIGVKYPLYNNNNCGFRYSLDTTKLAAGNHKLTIRETSKSGTQKTLSEINVNVSNKPRAATINYFLSENSTVTIEILDSSGKLIRTLESGSPKQAGWNSAKWDGRDLQGKIVPDGVYTYKITAVDYVGHSTTSKGTIVVERLVPSITSVIDTPDPFIPNKDGVNTIDFTISEDSLVTVKIYNNKGSLVKTLVNQSLKLGANKVNWDGTDDSGSAVPNGKYSYTVDAQDAFKKSAQQVSGSIDVGTTSLVISENTVSPDPFAPSGSNNATISYNLSGSSKVSITVFDSANNPVKTLESNVQKSQGVNSISWDGKDSSGMIVKDGIYGYKISAVEEGGLESSPATGIINISGAQENPLISSIDDTPDPFKPDGNSISTISFNLLENASVGIRIYSSGGATIKSIPAASFDSGINSFKWDGKDASGKIVSGGNYSYSIDASGIGNDKKQQVSGTITVDSTIPVISDTGISPDPFDPAANSTAVLSYKLSENAKVGIEIYDSSNTLVQILESNTDKSQGPNTANWDGKNFSGNTVMDGSYSYKITAIDYVGQEAKPVTGLFSVSGQNNPLLTKVSDSPDPFKPGVNNKSSINFTLSEKASVVINISDGNGSFVKNILNAIAGAGQNVVTWDGKDEAGKLTASGTYSYTIDAENMNGDKSQVVTGTIEVDNTPLTITGSTVNPNLFTPGSTNTTTISYYLSHKASVSVKIYDNLKTLVKTLEQGVNKAPGANSISWDGRDSNGTVVTQGNYSYTITAVNAEIGEAKPVSGAITVLDGRNGNSLTVSGVSDSPDPFSPNGNNVTTISYIISKDANVSIALYNSNGGLIKTLFDGHVQAGNNKVTWDGRNSSDNMVGIGTFTYIINAQDTSGNKAPQVSGIISVDYTAPVITFIGFSHSPFFADGQTDESIAYSLSENAAVNVTVSDSKGSIIRLLDSKSQKGTGANTSIWDGKDMKGSIVPAGSYTVKIEAVNSAGLAAKPVTAVISVQKAVTGNLPLLAFFNDYPDPFKPDGTSVSTIEYTLGRNANVSVGIYSSRNELIKTLWNGSSEKGTKELTWDGKNTGGALVSKGIYVYKIDVADMQNNQAHGLGTITVDYDAPRVIISGISPDPFEPLGSNNATISYILTKEADVTTEIFDSSENLVKKLETGVNKLSGTTSLSWDGKDLSGLLVKDGAYTVKITAVDLLNQTVVSTGLITILHTTPEIILVKDSPDPFKPGVVVNTIEFTLTKDAAVTVNVLDSNKNVLRTLVKSEMKAGINSVIWDGKDSSNTFVAGGIFTYTIDAVDSAGSKALQASGTITVDIAPPVISNTRVNRLPFTPDGTNAVTVLYDLSEKAAVNVKIYDSSNTLIKAVNPGQSNSEGLNWIEWDGKSQDGSFAAAGTYTYNITAVDPAGNTSRAATGTINVEAYNNTAATNIIDFEDDAQAYPDLSSRQLGSDITWNPDYGTEPEEVTAHRTWLNKKGIDISGTPAGFVWSTKVSGTAGKTGVIVGFASPNHIEQDGGLSNSEVLSVDLLSDTADMVELELTTIPTTDQAVDNIPATVTIKAFDINGNLVAEKTQNFMGVTHSSLTPVKVKLVSDNGTISKLTLETSETPYGGVYIESISFKSSGSSGNPETPTTPDATKLQFTGKWKITVTSKEAAWSQRVRISGSNGSDGPYDGTVGNSFIIDGDSPWLLSIEHNGGPGWEESLLKATEPVITPTQVSLKVLSEDNIYYPDDYNDMILTVEKVFPIPVPVPTPIPVPDPTNPTTPTDPGNPWDPANPTDPSNPSDPTNPVTPAIPVISAVSDSPDPFGPDSNETCMIKYTLSKDAVVTIKIYDSSSQLIRTLVNGSSTSGALSAAWDGKNDTGAVVVDGIYIYRIDAVDSAGNKAVQAAGSISVDGSFPVIDPINIDPSVFEPIE